MKKIITFVLALFFGVTMFAGCSLIELNEAKYYSQTVASISYKNKTKNFSMEDLLAAYNTYGYQLVQNNQELKPEDALKQTAEMMVQRHLLVEFVKEELKKVDEDLTVGEKNVLKREAYKNIDQALETLEKEVRIEWDRVVKEDESNKDDKAPLRAAYTPYKSSVKLENGDLVRVKPDKKQIDETDPGEYKQTITEEDISKEAWKRFIKNLQKHNEDLGKNLTDEQAFETELKRIYGVLEENKYIEKYQTLILDGVDVDNDKIDESYKQKYSGLEIDKNKAVESYKQKYNRDYELYSNDINAYREAVNADASKVYYHPNSGNEFVYVTHILFKFSDEQTKEIKKLEQLLSSNSIEKSVYDQRLKEIQSQSSTVVKYEQDGEVKTTNVVDAYNDILTNVSAFNKDGNFKLRAKEFNKFVYKYNDDEGIMNKDFAYVVNLDTSVEDKMVKPFADEARRLQNEEGVGAISKPILTEFGYHVLFNLGPVTNLVEPKNIDSLTWQALYNTTTQPASEKTLFDLEYDALNTDQTVVSQILDSKINDLVAECEVIKYWEKRYLTLLKQK